VGLRLDIQAGDEQHEANQQIPHGDISFA